MGIDAEHRQVVSDKKTPATALVIGGGPAGLFAAETLSAAGLSVTVVDRMPSFGRKFLMAGRGGLNLTHSEDLAHFKARYGVAEDALGHVIETFPPQQLIDWAEGLGQATFVGTSGRVFPKSMKASPLLRAWLARLATRGVTFIAGRRWIGWDDAGRPIFEPAKGSSDNDPLALIEPAVTILALGGASWPRLGSDGRWAATLTAAGVPLTPFAPSNAGVLINWSTHMVRHAGQPLKRIAVAIDGARARGEAIITRSGLEGGAIYAVSAKLRAALETGETPALIIDLRPDLSEESLAAHLAKPRGKQSLNNHLRKAAGLSPPSIAILREALGGHVPEDAAKLARAIKNARLRVSGFASLERAISTAGGIQFNALDANLMLKARPGVFAAGEMLDWDAPTGGYLLQATFATAHAAAHGALRWLAERPASRT